jgi:hypothetical protein
VSNSASAFPHWLGTGYCIHYYSKWQKPADTTFGVNDMKTFCASVRMPDAVYVNYCDADWMTGRAYWGPNLSRLKTIKKKYDQGISVWSKHLTDIITRSGWEPRMTDYQTPSLLPDPDFTCNLPDCVFDAGVRPYRKDIFRLEPEIVGNKFVVHNYGHGGAGMSWGCAAAVTDIVTAHVAGIRGKVAVIGQGVMGLTAATLLLARGFQVSIYADLTTVRTTSDRAGGQLHWPIRKPSSSRAANPRRLRCDLRT